MRTVEQLVKDYERYNWTRPITERPFWSFVVRMANILEGRKFIITQFYSNGAIRLALPDWYKLNPNPYNSNEILSTIINELYGFKIEYIRIHEQGIVVKVVDE